MTWCTLSFTGFVRARHSNTLIERDVSLEGIVCLYASTNYVHHRIKFVNNARIALIFALLYSDGCVTTAII
jgi:hypothetical protein